METGQESAVGLRILQSHRLDVFMVFLMKRFLIFVLQAAVG